MDIMYSYDRSYIETPRVLKELKRNIDLNKVKMHPPPTKMSSGQSYSKYVQKPAEDFQIIVFGYEEHDRDLVFQKLSRIGIIEDHKDLSKYSMGIKYKDPGNAIRACDLNGQVLIENTMIGVYKIKDTPSAGFASHVTEDPYEVAYLKKRSRRRKTLFDKIKIYIFNIQ